MTQDTDGIQSLHADVGQECTVADFRQLSPSAVVVWLDIGKCPNSILNKVVG